MARSNFRTLIAIELARRNMRQRDLARLLKVPPTTLSDWLTEAHPGPQDLRTRIMSALSAQRSTE